MRNYGTLYRQTTSFQATITVNFQQCTIYMFRKLLIMARGTVESSFDKTYKYKCAIRKRVRNIMSIDTTSV